MNDYCHPRFIALMLCLSDLLDLNKDRFNEYFLDVITPLPNDSAMHKSKHECIVHLM
ncbi:HD domain-containing protein [Vallitalea maricola]|uniref:HD domain-containing protein n=1 Tax=Vallitalea maricola TaxID=3074433 RepID=UPI003C12C257